MLFLDGVSLMPLLAAEGEFQRDALYWHYPHYNQHPQSFPSGVIRAGEWKLVEAFETGKRSLYNLASDLGETTDLAEQNPEKATELYGHLKAWRDRVGADPMLPNPEYTGEKP